MKHNEYIESLLNNIRKNKFLWTEIEMSCGEKIYKISFHSLKELNNNYLVECLANFKKATKKILLIFSKESCQLIRCIPAEECLYCSNNIDVFDLYNNEFTETCKECLKLFD